MKYEILFKNGEKLIVGEKWAKAIYDSIFESKGNVSTRTLYGSEANPFFIDLSDITYLIPLFDNDEPNQ